MQISYFLLWHASGARHPAFDVEAAARCLRAWSRDVPQLTRYILHIRGAANDPRGDDVGGPTLVLQCYFDDTVALDLALASNGAFERLLQHDVFRDLQEAAACDVSQQAMLVRCYTPPAREVEHETHRCTYLVAYERGTASSAGYDAWLADYLTHHVPLLQSFPGLLELEVYTPIHWPSALPYPRARAAQRNKVVFDDSAALTHALHSPVRQALREHSLHTPSLGGDSTHYPMTSRSWQLALQPARSRETT
ncbi:ethyl tert-butyl ether degradation protein EthD [Paraburkholderia sediminicola]|uniref:ethyl tert-butyl ether degradation protein EthD n=1 Tax=Paraburkholderia sediminicola TaxID=458836 RepID=UPI0038BD62A7